MRAHYTLTDGGLLVLTGVRDIGACSRTYPVTGPAVRARGGVRLFSPHRRHARSPFIEFAWLTACVKLSEHLEISRHRKNYMCERVGALWLCKPAL